MFVCVPRGVGVCVWGGEGVGGCTAQHSSRQLPMHQILLCIYGLSISGVLACARMMSPLDSASQAYSNSLHHDRY